MVGLLLLGCSTSVRTTESKPCVDCHPAAVEAWSGSHHALAERELTPTDGWAAELGAVRILGVHPLEQAIVPVDGRLQVHDRAFDVRDGSRFSIFTDARDPGDWGHWTGGGMTWNARCASCHNTGVRKGLQPDGTYETTVDSVGIGCAACHGDASEHAAGGPPPKNARMEDTCLACHTRRAELTDAFVPGDRFLDHYVPLTVADPDFRADGRGLAEVFEGNQFLASKMHAAGVRCGSCHEPHSGALLEAGDALCDRCHAQLEMPDHPPPAGELCVDCHMPKSTVMVRHARRDHGFAHPAPERDRQTVAFDRVRRGGPLADLDLRPTVRGRHAAVLELLSGRPDGLAVLRDRLDHPDPLIRTAAVNALVPAERSDLERLERSAIDPVRAVRVGAQRSLARAGKPLGELPDLQAYFAHNADDPNVLSERGILRVQAGDLRGLDDLIHAVRLDPVTPRWTVLLATGLTANRQVEKAEQVLQAGLIRHPQSTELRVSLALTLAALKQTKAAIAELERVVQSDPNHAKAWRNLALLYDREEDRTATLRALERAIQLQPNDQELIAWKVRLQ